MRYILDFDGVIFNTQKLKELMALHRIDESSRSASLFDEIKASEPSFDVASLVFEDAKAFLESHKDACVVVSSYVSTNPKNDTDIPTQNEYQVVKIRLAGIPALIGDHNVHVVGASKQEALKTLKNIYDKNGEQCIFVDDRLMYVQESESAGIPALLMDRYGTTEHKSVPTIASFAELQVKAQELISRESVNQ